MMGVLSLTGAGVSSLPIVSRGTRGCARDPAGGVEFSVLSLGGATGRLKGRDVYEYGGDFSHASRPPLAHCSGGASCFVERDGRR